MALPGLTNVLAMYVGHIIMLCISISAFAKHPSVNAKLSSAIMKFVTVFAVHVSVFAVMVFTSSKYNPVAVRLVFVFVGLIPVYVKLAAENVKSISAC
jgi:hypothetical protein